MLVRDEFGNLIFQPRNLCFADGDGGDAGGSGGDAGGADTTAGGEDGDTQPGGEGGEAGKTKLGAGGSDTLEGGDKGAADWRAGITDEKLRDHAGRFSSLTDLVKGNLDLRSERDRLKATAIVKPGKDAKPEEIAEFHKALGVPEKPEDYKVEIPEAVKESWGEADEALKGSFLGKLHAAGATPAVVNAAMGWYFEATQKMVEERDAAGKKATDEAESALQKEWGADAKANDAMASRAAKEFGDEAFIQFLEEKEVDGIKLGNHPAFRKAFAAIGRAMSEDKPLIGQDADAAQTAKEAADDARRKRNEAMAKGDRASAQRWDEEERRLLAKVYGNAPIVGQEGRTL